MMIKAGILETLLILGMFKSRCYDVTFYAYKMTDTVYKNLTIFCLLLNLSK